MSGASQVGPAYVAYIDEAGDPGLKHLRPDNPQGGSEWFMLAAAVIAGKNEMAVRAWVDEMMAATKGYKSSARDQRASIHFRTLHESHKKHREVPQCQRRK